MLAEAAESVKEQSLNQTLTSGVGFIHSGMTAGDRKKVLQLYKGGAIGVLVCTYDSTWSLDVTAHFVAILGTESYDGKEARYVDYAISDVLNMMGKAGRVRAPRSCCCRPPTCSTCTDPFLSLSCAQPSVDNAAKCLIMCHTPKKEHLKKLLFEPLPVESHLDSYLHDNFCSEICTKVIENQQEALDYLTWSFLYRRLTKNPIYYGLSGTTPQHLSEHLSDIVEVVLGDLAESKCIELDEDEGDVSPLNLGMVGSFYYLTYSTIELVAASVTAKTKTRGIVEILSAATEFGGLSMRHNEHKTLRMLARNLPYTNDEASWNDPNNKALVLLQSHFERKGMNPDLKQDQKEVLGKSVTILQAIVDVIASK
jgi:pre-mRNA-splicing helicase BRR2